MNLTQLKSRRAEAKRLKRNLDKIEKAHETHIEKWIKSNQSQKRLTPERRKQVENAYASLDKKFETREDCAYKAYYNHMHRDFDTDNNKIKFTSKKYKEGFCDLKYIDDMYDQKEKEIRKQKNSTKRRK